MFIATEPKPDGEPVPFDLREYDSSSAEALDDGRIRIDISHDVVLIGTATELLDLSAAITSHTHSILVEMERRGVVRRVA